MLQDQVRFFSVPRYLIRTGQMILFLRCDDFRVARTSTSVFSPKTGYHRLRVDGTLRYSSTRNRSASVRELWSYQGWDCILRSRCSLLSFHAGFLTKSPSVARPPSCFSH